MSEEVEVPLEDLEGWLEREAALVVDTPRSGGRDLVDIVEGTLNEFWRVCRFGVDREQGNRKG